ncbi:MAG: Dihydroflavonol-4-reductase [uncultured bacterium]|nr:MAG: Dihydroflavonol-4-reductase [uncultured bacterium]HBY01313.1 dihydroflavonol 4-reductase [Rikenellaceae bacterium]
MKKVFVTGANGLLGTNLINELLFKGYRVKGLLRDKTKYQGPAHENLELTEGNLADNLAPVLMDCDCIVHVAAVTSQSLLKYSDYIETNYDATVHLFNLAVQCNIKKFIFVSSVNTIGHGSRINPGTEKDEIRVPFDSSFYAMSKLQAENYLLQNNQKTEVIIVNPSFMLGGYDSKPSSGKIILMFWKKRVLFYPPGGKNFVHVVDVADGIISSIERGVNGEKYILANENLNYRDFFEKLNSQTKRNPIMIRIPGFVLIPFGYFGDVLRFFRVKTNLSSVNTKILCVNNFYSNRKSVSELNINYHTTDKAIKDAINYFIKH